MRASLASLKLALKNQEVPAKIWQKAYDRDTAHLYRLLQLKDKKPHVGDLVDYVLDFRYEEIQSDLFRYLIPTCFAIWHKYLFEPHLDSPYGAFIEHFSTALQDRSVFEEVLDKTEYEAVVSFWSDAILDRIDQEELLHFSGQSAIYKWFRAISSFAISLPRLSQLWQEWWELETQGQAVAIVQYISCFVYEENNNPIFTPWTPEHGGGPPDLWQTDGLVQVKGWREENISFLKNTFTPEYIEAHLQKATDKLKIAPLHKVAQKVLSDFYLQQDLLKSRLELLPDILGKPQPNPDEPTLWS